MKDALKLIGGVLLALLVWSFVLVILIVLVILFARAIGADVEGIYRFIGCCTVSYIAFKICDIVADKVLANKNKGESNG